MISIIIPCRNEEKFVDMCLDSIIAQDYPREKLEVLVIDGTSEDKTGEILRKYTKQHSFIKVINNKKKIIPAALNIGIKNAKGEIIIRMDAHTTYPKDYISKCIYFLDKYHADAVGGVIKTIPQDNGFIGKTVVLSLSHPFGVGASSFRIGSKKPRWVNTIFSGCYKREILDNAGPLDERIELSEDLIYNLKLKRAGAKLLLVPEIISYYHPRSDFRSFCKHNFRNGTWVILPFKYIKMPVSLRHLVPLFFVLSLVVTGILGIFLRIFLWLFLVIIGSYILSNFYSSLKISIKKRSIKYFLLMPIIFTTLHLTYGIGSSYGLIKLIKGK